MRFHPKQFLGALVVLALAMPLWARTNSSHTDSTTLDADQGMTIGKTQLQPGQYTLKATESGDQLEVRKDGQLIASVPCHWVELSKKASDSEIISDQHRVIQVQFQGRTEAAKIG
ncbi:MAG TPA: hypothetical protein VJO53_05860 [Candidatus Acidoferrales bacterium]|nr:hypothetical protein [Candidatus Acidoferrales bacterium]